MKVKLSNGFEFEAKDNLGKDVRLLELLRRAAKLERKIQDEPDNKELNAEYNEALMNITDKVFGAHKGSLYDYLEDENGIVDYELVLKCMSEATETLQEVDTEVKNS